MTPAARRSIIVHQMIGERPAMRELFSELVNTKNKDLYHGGPDKGLAAVVRRIFEFCKPYEQIVGSKVKPGVGSVAPGTGQSAGSDGSGWDQMQQYTDEQWAAWDSVLQFAAFQGVSLNIPQDDQ